jgi:hypothetical protein
MRKCIDVNIVYDTKDINYIKENGYITNRLSRECLGFGKTKSLDLFNRLIDLNEIEKIGAGVKTQYRLKEEK